MLQGRVAHSHTVITDHLLFVGCGPMENTTSILGPHPSLTGLETGNKQKEQKSRQK